MASTCLRCCAIAAIFLLQACNKGLFRTDGNSEKGYFQVEPTDNLAVGGWLTYTVRDYEFALANVSGIGFQLVSASNDGAAHIRSMNPNADLVVDGLAPGQSRIDFSAMADGDRIDDAFLIEVQAVTHLRFTPCREGGVYVRGTDGQVNYTFSNSDVATIKGRGLFPFAIAPAAGVTFKPELSTENVWQFAIPGSAPDGVRLVSTVPGDIAEYAMTIIDARAIDGVSASTASSNTYYGRTMTIPALPISAGRPLCTQLRRIATSNTPSICKLIGDGLGVTSLELGTDTVRVDFIAAGTCSITLSLPDLGITVAWPPWKLTTAEPTSGGGSSWDD